MEASIYKFVYFYRSKTHFILNKLINIQQKNNALF